MTSLDEARAIAQRSKPVTEPPSILPKAGKASAVQGPIDAILHPPIVAIGASAGGLEAASKLFTCLSDRPGMAFILVQHLEPDHPSMMVELLAKRTAMQVVEASEGAFIEPDRLYVIPPGRFLSVESGTLHLSEPPTHHGVRLPFDFLLESLARGHGPRSACIILSGTGSDGSQSLPAFKAAGGLIIAQQPQQAEYSGMPESGIKTGLVDAILPVEKMPAALTTFAKSAATKTVPKSLSDHGPAATDIADIIRYLHQHTSYDFRQYKPGTMERRIVRRMGLLGVPTKDLGHYLELLEVDANEREQLALDLLINVTSFFRDSKVFEYLAESILPDLIMGLADHQSLRIWVAGCSTGEEAYSIAMLCREAMAAANREVKLQIFASDIDPDAIATAREGLYPLSISADVSSARLARFFTKDDHGYRVVPGLRGEVVFTVQDLLTDPPFSRIDLVSCRNVLIYLNPEAQAKVIGLFHFALREQGVLVLGGSETAGSGQGLFKQLLKTERVYRHVVRRREADPGFPVNFGNAPAAIPVTSAEAAPSRQATLARLCRDMVLDTHAPAAVLINQKHQCLYSLGPTERYLRIAPGYASLDLLAMVSQSLRTRLRLAIERTGRQAPRTEVGRTRLTRDGKAIWFKIDVSHVESEGEDLRLVCFVEEPAPEPASGPKRKHIDENRISDLERELEASQNELQDNIQKQQTSSQEQKAVNEEALSVNEEFQSTNEELLTSKEELQSLNEELTALNSQLQETLERQRTTSDDLQNVLYSTNVATLFLDTDLKIRFFTPATRSLFKVIPGDIGRPLADLNSLAADDMLLADARAVLAGEPPVEREIAAPSSRWFMRRILPYRTHDGGIEGVVITFDDITERNLIAAALDATKQKAEQATIAKSRFLAAASHDLRQPLQTLTLLQAMLAQTVEGDKGRKLVHRLDETLGAMTGMLNALLDINQIEAGVIKAQASLFPISQVMAHISDEFSYMAEAKGLRLRILPIQTMVNSDPRLLEQMIRNLLGNALKYTTTGGILLGCRRRGDMLRIEIWDTGIGIAAGELRAIFEEFHQIDNPARERSRGLGLGLTIVQQLGHLLGHAVHVRSVPGKGSVFSIDVARGSDQRRPASPPVVAREAADNPQSALCKIIVVEDDPDVRDLIAQLLQSQGHTVKTAADGHSALSLISKGAIRPDILLTDYNLPNGMTGLELLATLEERLPYRLPGIILTGDISTNTLALIQRQDCVSLSKPVKAHDLAAAISQLLPEPVQTTDAQHPVVADHKGQITHVVDDDADIRASVRDVLEAHGHFVEDYASAESFLAGYRPGGEDCLLVDDHLPGLSGIGLLKHLRSVGDQLPTIVITGASDIDMAVEAMKAGACDFIEKPVSKAALLASLAQALAQSHDISIVHAHQQEAAKHVASLTTRQQEVMQMVLAGHPSKNIAADLGISQRTVENHRAAIMEKMGVRSMPALARLALAAASHVGSDHDSAALVDASPVS